MDNLKLRKDQLDPADFYRPPTPLASAIQQPLHPIDRWQAGVLACYAATKQPAALTKATAP